MTGLQVVILGSGSRADTLRAELASRGERVLVVEGEVDLDRLLVIAARTEPPTLVYQRTDASQTYDFARVSCDIRRALDRFDEVLDRRCDLGEDLDLHEHEDWRGSGRLWDARASALDLAPPPEVDTRWVVYLDPPYAGTRGYGVADLDRSGVLVVARRWARAGAIVVVSEDEPLLALGRGWAFRRITDTRVGRTRNRSRQREEWLSIFRPEGVTSCR